MNTYREEKLPQVVEDRLQEAYDIIRKEERKKMKKRRLQIPMHKPEQPEELLAP